VVTKERLHQLIEALPERERDTAARVLEALAGLAPGEPFYTLNTAIRRRRTMSPRPRRSGRPWPKGEADLVAGRVVAAAEVERRYGL
jgi:hypothetical protein